MKYRKIIGEVLFFTSFFFFVRYHYTMIEIYYFDSSVTFNGFRQTISSFLSAILLLSLITFAKKHRWFGFEKKIHQKLLEKN